MLLTVFWILIVIAALSLLCLVATMCAPNLEHTDTDYL